jgi:hypothetical protein
MNSDGIFDFKDLRNFNGDYTVSSDFSDPEKKTLTFNFCKLIQGCGSSNTFASLETEKDGNCYELTDGNNQGVLTSGISSPSGADGIRIEREGGAPCPSDDSRKIGFVVDVFCNEAINGASPPPMKMIYSGSELDDIDDSCVYHV